MKGGEMSRLKQIGLGGAAAGGLVGVAAAKAVAGDKASLATTLGGAAVGTALGGTTAYFLGKKKYNDSESISDNDSESISDTNLFVKNMVPKRNILSSDRTYNFFDPNNVEVWNTPSEDNRIKTQNNPLVGNDDLLEI